MISEISKRALMTCYQTIVEEYEGIGVNDDETLDAYDAVMKKLEDLLRTYDEDAFEKYWAEREAGEYADRHEAINFTLMKMRDDTRECIERYVFEYFTKRYPVSAAIQRTREFIMVAESTAASKAEFSLPMEAGALSLKFTRDDFEELK